MAISSISNRLRISGMASGMDTESIVRNMMQIEQYKYDKQWKIKAKLEFRQEALTKMQNLVRDFRNDFFSQASKNASMLSRYSFVSYSTTTDDTKGVADVKAVGANAGSVEITRIMQLAKGASSTSGDPVSMQYLDTATSTVVKQPIKLTDKLRNLSLATGLDFDRTGAGANDPGKISFSINGREFTFSSEDTLQTVISTVNNDAYAGVKMTYSSATDTLNITSNQTGAAAKMIILDTKGGNFLKAFNMRTGLYGGQDAQMIINGSTVDATTAYVGSSAWPFSNFDVTAKLEDLQTATPLVFDASGKTQFTINGVGFEFDKTATLDFVLNTVNSTAAANARMSFIDTNQGATFFVESKTTGNSATLQLSETGGTNFLSALNLAPGTYKGKDSYIAGTLVTNASNNFTLDGFEYNLRKVTDTPITVSAKLDEDKIVGNIRAFVDAYNTFVVSVNQKLREKTYRGFEPLTSDERASLAESEAAIWDAQAKSGLMRNDSDLSRLLSEMRGMLFTQSGGTGKMMSDIGISTIPYTRGDEYGTLQIDENVLRSAIQNDPEAVADMFVKTSSSSDSAIKSAETGYAQKLYALMNTYTNETVRETNNRYNDSLYKMESRLSEMLSKLQKKEESLYARFTAMETALSKLNAQSDWLASQLSALNS